MKPEDFQKLFPVCSIAREDLVSAGFPKELLGKLDDGLMEDIAEKLGDALMDCYWISLGVIIDEVIKR